MIGPNCPGIITPEESLAGITPHTIAGKGPVGLVSKSGTLTYQMMYELKDYGFTTAIGIGGDPIIGTTHIDALEAFENDPETKAIVMIGEIGGDAEERAAAYIKEHVTKPVVGYVAGFTAPEGKTMGHAGAIVSGSSGTAQAKKEALEAAGVKVGKTPSETAELMRAVLRRSLRRSGPEHPDGPAGPPAGPSGVPVVAGGWASHSSRHTTWAPSRRTGATAVRRRGDGRVGQAELASVDGMDMVLAPRFRERAHRRNDLFRGPRDLVGLLVQRRERALTVRLTISRAEPTRVTWKTELPSPSAYVRPIVTVS